MELYILNSRYETIGMIDEAESVLWNKKYNDEGYCEIYAPCDEAYTAILKKGYYVFRYDDDMFCKIQSVEIQTDVENGDYIIATGADAAKTLLSGRIVRWQITYSGTVAGFIRKVLRDNVINPAQTKRAVKNFIIDESNFPELTEKINISAFTDDLFSLIVGVCKAAQYGFRLSYDIERRLLVFRLYKGKNKASPTSEEYVEFSPTYANIISSKYKEDESNYRNVAYVGYKLVNSDEAQTQLYSVYKGDTEPQGEDRREIYVDGTGISREITLEELENIYGKLDGGNLWRQLWTATTNSTETKGYNYYIGKGDNSTLVAGSEITTSEGDKEEEKIEAADHTYYLFIRTFGITELDQYNQTQEFTGEVDTLDTYEYKSDYNLGDIVKAADEYGNEADARIVEILESEDNEDGYIVEPKFEYIN